MDIREHPDLVGVGRELSETSASAHTRCVASAFPMAGPTPGHTQVPPQGRIDDLDFLKTVLLRHDSHTIKLTCLKYTTPWLFMYSQRHAPVVITFQTVFRHFQKKL